MSKRGILAAGLCVASVGAFGALRSVTPAAWDGGKPNSWQMKRHNEKLAEIATNGGAKVVFLGDSITHFWEMDSTWKRYFTEGETRALCLGTGGDRTEHVLWRITEGKELDGYEAKVVFLMIGTNNAGCFPFAKEPPADVILGIRKIVRTIREKQPKALVVLTAIFPRGLKPDDPCRLRNEVVNREIRYLTDGRNVVFMELTDMFLLPDGTLPLGLFPDRLHPVTRAYEMWYAAARPYIEYAFSDRRIPPACTYSRASGIVYRTDEPVFPSARFASYNSEIKIGEKTFDWGDRLLANRTKIADGKGRFDLVLIGGTRLHRWEVEDPEAFAAFGEGRSVLNLGYGDDGIENIVWRCENGELDGYAASCVVVDCGRIGPALNHLLATVVRKQPKAHVMLMPELEKGLAPKDEMAAVYAQAKAFLPKKATP